MRIHPVKTAADVEQARQLFLEYAHSLDFDLGFQDFDAELQSLPGNYAPPWGCLLLAVSDSEAMGCIALRRLSDHVCEMKRLWVRPAFRGTGTGRRLIESLLDEAYRIGYSSMRLDTVPSMASAISLYRQVGFVEIEPYTSNPIPGALFLQFDLRTRPPRSNSAPASGNS